MKKSPAPTEINENRSAGVNTSLSSGVGVLHVHFFSLTLQKWNINEKVQNVYSYAICIYACDVGLTRNAGIIRNVFV